MIRLLLFLAASSVVVLSAAPAPEFFDVFPANSNGVTRHRIPGAVVTTKGTVLAYCEARINNSSDWGEIEVHLRRSTDGGRTWDAPRRIAHRGAREHVTRVMHAEVNPRNRHGKGPHKAKATAQRGGRLRI